ncbi:MAG: DNA polymerase III subunit delta' [Pseudomonadota bacterium]
MPLDAISGHRLPIEILRGMLHRQQIPHAFIFSGIEGIGKRTAAAAFIKALNCREREADFCDVCLSCRKIEKQVHPDCHVIEPEKNIIKIEQIRSLQADIAFKPLEGKKKAVILDQAEKLNSQAANCLLKTLEEPPEDTVIILISRGTAGMLPTVLSRCQHIRFSPLGDEDILQLLCRQGLAALKAQQLLPHAHGSIKRALFLAETDFLDRRNEIAELLSPGLSKNAEAMLALAKRLRDDDTGIVLVLEFIQSWYRDLLVLKEGLSGSDLYNADMAEALNEAAAGMTRDALIRKIKKIQWLRNNAVLNIDTQLALESAFLYS